MSSDPSTTFLPILPISLHGKEDIKGKAGVLGAEVLPISFHGHLETRLFQLGLAQWSEQSDSASSAESRERLKVPYNNSMHSVVSVF